MIISLRHLCTFFLSALLFSACSSKQKTEEEYDGQHDVSGNTIELFESPAAPGSGEPNLFVAENGKVYLSWLETVKDNNDMNALRYSVLEDGRWSAPKTVAQSDNWFVNWADFPSLVAYPDGSLAAHWLTKSGEGSYHYNIYIAQSPDQGKTWGEPVIPHKDGKKAEHGFVTMFPVADDQLFITWLDGRNTAGIDHGSDHEGHGSPEAAMTLRSAKLDRNGNLSEESLLDDRVCDCCQTGAAMTSNGPVVVYRNRSEDEVRDIYIVRNVDEKWTEPKVVAKDEWHIAGCPVNGPAIDAIGNHLAIAWFTAANGTRQVNLVFSEDGGASFSNPIKIDQGNPLGRVDVALMEDHTAMVSWLENKNGSAEILVSRFSKSGKELEEIKVASSKAARASGFPRMVSHQEALIFAWTDVDSVSSVKTARYKL